jgi:hypothetical protein
MNLKAPVDPVGQSEPTDLPARMMNALISSHHQASIPQSEQGKPRNASENTNKK